MARGLRLEGEGAVDVRPHGLGVFGPFGQSGGDVDARQGVRDGLDRARQGPGRFAPGFEHLHLDGQGALARLGDAGVQFGQLHGREANLVGHGLAVNEDHVERRPHQGLGLPGAGFDEIAEHGVVADAHRRAAFGLQARFQGDDHKAAVVPEGAGLVQLEPHARRHETAVSRQGGQVRSQAELEGAQEVTGGALARLLQRLQRRRQFAGWFVQRISRAGEQAGERIGGPQPVTKGAQVAGAAPPERKAGQRPREIGRTLQGAADVLAQGAAVQQPCHGIQAGVDAVWIEQRARQPRRQHPRAAGGHGPVDRGQQRALTRARLAFLDFEADPRGRIDGHDVRFAGAPGRGQGRQPACLGGLQVGGDQAQRRDLGARQGAEAVQGLHAVESLQPGFGGGRLGQGGRHGLNHPARRLQGRGHRLVREQPVRHQDLGGRQRRQRRAQAVAADRPALDLAGGDLHAGHRRLAGAQGDGRQPVGAAGVQQAFFGQGARRHHPDHVAPDHRLGAAFASLRRVLHLLADRHLEAGPDQLGEIGFGGVHGHARHGNGGPRVGPARREGDPKRLGRLGRVLEEQLVEVAHAEEHQRVRLAGLGLEELGHHRRSVGGYGQGGGGVHRPATL